ncbi:MAG: hypothetical protein ACT4NV_03005 [Rhodoferax sp.]
MATLLLFAMAFGTIFGMRYLRLMGYAWLVVYNFTLLALVTLVPLWAVWQIGWLAAALLGLAALVAWLVKNPSALLGLLIGLHR